MRVEYLRGLMLGVLTLLIPSCMHMGMMGEGDHSAGDSILEKEVIVGKVKVNVTLPPMQSGIPVVLTVRLTLDSLGTALHGANVELEVKKISGSTNSAESLVLDESQEGVYTITYEPIQSGQYDFAFTVTELETGMLAAPVVVEATRTVADGGHEHDDGSHGSPGGSAVVVVGVAAMVAMMIVMATSR